MNNDLKAVLVGVGAGVAIIGISYLLPRPAVAPATPPAPPAVSLGATQLGSAYRTISAAFNLAEAGERAPLRFGTGAGQVVTLRLRQVDGRTYESVEAIRSEDGTIHLVFERTR